MSKLTVYNLVAICCRTTIGSIKILCKGISADHVVYHNAMSAIVEFAIKILRSLKQSTEAAFDGPKYVDLLLVLRQYMRAAQIAMGLNGGSWKQLDVGPSKSTISDLMGMCTATIDDIKSL